MTTAPRYGCPRCQRIDLTITRDNALRKHTANGKRRTDDNPYCPGKVPEVAKAPGTCPGCEHAEHSGECRELIMDGAPGDVDECGCLSPGPALDPSSIEDPSTAAENGAPVEVLPGPCDLTDSGVHEYVFGECACEHPQPGYIEPSPVLAASVPVVQNIPVPGADVLMGTAHDATEGDAMDVLMADDRPTDGRDKLYRNGRYALPDPLTGQPRTWTRATTMAETLSDLYSLNRWRIRMMLIGLARFPDLLTELQEIDGDGEEGLLDPKLHKDVLNKIGDRAQSLAGSKVPANWGTEMHNNIEALSRDEITVDQVPEKYRDEVTAWAAAMQEAELSAVPHLIERRVAVPLYGTAGTFDQIDRVHRGRSVRLGSRVVRLDSGEHVVGDVKSGRSLDYAWGEISIQMALYAQGARLGKIARWDPDADTGDPEDPGAWVWEDIGIPPKSIRTDIGVVMHVPIGSGECTLHWIDLTEGWKAVQLCESVRDWRKVKGLHMPFSIAEVKTSAPSARPVVRAPSWDERFQAITTKDQGRTVYRSWLASGGDPDSPQAAAYRKVMKDRISQLTESTA